MNAKRNIYKCKRCDYFWIREDKKGKPIRCANPGCRSPYWNKEKSTGIKNAN